MNARINVKGRVLTLVGLAALAGCAGTGSLMRSPGVELSSVQIVSVGVNRQTFELGFSVYNPNPYPLPVRGIRYNVRLNDQPFAGGETRGDMSLPAEGDGHFTITVDLDLLRSGTQLTSLLRSGMRDNLTYELYGKLQLDLPASPSLDFTGSGTIAVQTAAR